MALHKICLVWSCSGGGAVLTLCLWQQWQCLQFHTGRTCTGLPLTAETNCDPGLSSKAVTSTPEPAENLLQMLVAFEATSSLRAYISGFMLSLVSQSIIMLSYAITGVTLSQRIHLFCCHMSQILWNTSNSYTIPKVTSLCCHFIISSMASHYHCECIYSCFIDTPVTITLIA